jgi:hypothetical protein
VSAIGWVYFLTLLSVVPLLAGFVRFHRTFNCPPTIGVHHLRWAWVFMMIACMMLCVAGAIMWDELGWPDTAR